MKNYYVHIMASNRNGTLYIGATSDLNKRVMQHKIQLIQGFTNKYNVNKLVYFEYTNNVEAAIIREKQLKKWNRAWKINLIEQKNPDWQELLII